VCAMSLTHLVTPGNLVRLAARTGPRSTEPAEPGHSPKVARLFP
jgi:hypothetical protein